MDGFCTYLVLASRAKPLLLMIQAQHSCMCATMRRFKVREGAELQSRAITNTREPDWGGEEFAFLVHEPTHQALHLVMWDKDIVGKDEEVGW